MDTAGGMAGREVAGVADVAAAAAVDEGIEVRPVPAGEGGGAIDATAQAKRNTKKIPLQSWRKSNQ